MIRDCHPPEVVRRTSKRRPCPPPRAIGLWRGDTEFARWDGPCVPHVSVDHRPLRCRGQAAILSPPSCATSRSGSSWKRPSGVHGEELTTANAELARAARLKDEFLASMSHELRTPLNGILNISQGLAEEVYGTMTPRQQEALHDVEEVRPSSPVIDQRYPGRGQGRGRQARGRARTDRRQIVLSGHASGWSRRPLRKRNSGSHSISTSR